MHFIIDSKNLLQSLAALGKNAMQHVRNWWTIDSDNTTAVVPEKMQIAALCYKRSSEGLQILLITSRGTGRWILPKGWPESKENRWKTARQEAYEEAGVIGKPRHDPIGTFNSYKDLNDGTRIPTLVTVYPVKVKSRKKSFPEAGQREFRWLPIEQAARAEGMRTLYEDALAKAADGATSVEEVLRTTRSE